MVTNAAMVFTLLCVSHGIEAKEATHIGGHDNYRCYQLSRIAESGLAVADILVDIRLGGTRDLMLEKDCKARKLMECCRSARHFSSEGLFWKEIKKTVGASLVTNPPSHLFPPPPN